ncbi:MAG: LysM peptidoglycan-binding domain-containing protein [Spirochaetaceae bacterium]|jgi:murein DD-endopeptidase MepM/ murein hydrolase activator NlpD|nr:LysM peptidoglycan-binding domain-containing protein [Spirochaetaceae bacterium]
MVKNKIHVSVCFLLCLTVLAVYPSLYAEDIVHIVKYGETIYSMSRAYGVNVEDILLLNSIDDVRKIYPGQKILIPSSSLMAGPISGGSAPPAVIKHKAEKGETLYGIARTYGIQLKTLLAANNLSERSILRPGDILKIPDPVLPQKDVRTASSDTFLVDGLAKNKSAGAGETASSKDSGAQGTGTAAAKTGGAQRDWPVDAKESAYITTGKLSSGMVLTGEKSEPVLSISSGTVVFAGPYRGYGRIVIVKTGSGYDYFYGGCEKISVNKGDHVVPGIEIGKLGVNAATSKPQLTFIVHHNQKLVDPAKAPRS